jgi:hypothetical protein
MQISVKRPAASMTASTCSLDSVVSSFACLELDELTPFWPSEGSDITDEDDEEQDCEFLAPGCEEWSTDEAEDGCTVFLSSEASLTISLVSCQW